MDSQEKVGDGGHDTTRSIGHILVVDDDQLIQVFLSEVLTREGYYVTCASDGEEAVGLLEKGHFDLIITDIVMPGGLNGLDVLRTARRIDPHYRVIVMTGYNYVETAERVMRLGAADFIPKPFNLTLITMTVARVLETKGDGTTPPLFDLPNRLPPLQD